MTEEKIRKLGMYDGVSTPLGEKTINAYNHGGHKQFDIAKSGGEFKITDVRPSGRRLKKPFTMGIHSIAYWEHDTEEHDAKLAALEAKARVQLAEEGATAAAAEQEKLPAMAPAQELAPERKKPGPKPKAE